MFVLMCCVHVWFLKGREKRKGGQCIWLGGIRVFSFELCWEDSIRLG